MRTRELPASQGAQWVAGGLVSHLPRAPDPRLQHLRRSLRLQALGSRPLARLVATEGQVPPPVKRRRTSRDPAATKATRSLGTAYEDARLASCGHVVGVDEAGRGPLAGPVVAAACCLPPGIQIPGVGDSKQVRTLGDRASSLAPPPPACGLPPNFMPTADRADRGGGAGAPLSCDHERPR